MSSQYGYIFYFDLGSDLLTFPITPSELTISSGSNNKVITLISEGDVNILKSPSLTEIEFEARFPMRKYPYSRNPQGFDSYLKLFDDVKVNKVPFRFIVARTSLSGTKTWSTNMKVSLEDVSLKESADNGDDVIVTFKLKQYKDYGVTYLKKNAAATTSTSNKPRSTDNKGSTSSVYVVKPGDCLWNIAKAAYGDGSKWTIIYEANKSAINADARKHGKADSSNGHWIWAGLKLTIPGIDEANKLEVTKLKNGKSAGSYTGDNATKQTLK